MRRVPPSTVIREQIDRLLAGGVAPETNLLSLAELGLRYVVKGGLEQEQRDFLERATTSFARAMPPTAATATAMRSRP